MRERSAMPEKNTNETGNVAVTESLPWRIFEILAALPTVAWVENSEGKILAHNRGIAVGIKGRACSPGAPQTTHNKHGGFGVSSERDSPPTALPPCATPPLPPIQEYPQGLRLVTIVPDARETGWHARVVAALRALLPDVPRPDELQFTPQQRAILAKLSQGLSFKEAAYELHISHDTVLTQVARMRKRYGFEVIPRQRRRRNAP